MLDDHIIASDLTQEIKNNSVKFSDITFENISQLKGTGVKLTLGDEVYIDAVSGTFNLPLGYNHKQVASAIAEQVKRVSHVSSSFVSSLSDALIKELVEDAPHNIDSGWVRDITGSTANECAIKICQKATGKSEVISLHLSHHGQTSAMTAVSGNSFRRSGFPSAASQHSVKIPAPYCHRCFYNATFPSCGMLCVEKINDFIEYDSNDSVACLIIEPILGNGGNVVPPPGYFQALEKLCKEKGILIIADEVQTGMGRLGHMYGCNAFGFKPNLITLAKGLGGIGIPTAAVLMESRLNTLQSFQHSFTSGSNMLSLVAANETTRIIKNKNFLREVRRKGKLIGEKLTLLGENHRMISDVRGMGMMWGIEISNSDGSPAPALANRIINRALTDEKLILRGSRYGFGNVVKIRPALITSDEDLIEILDKLERVLIRCAKERII